MHSSIFSGQVNHWRTTPVAHAFRYRVFMMYLDLGELDEVFAGRWFWSTKGWALARYRRENYFGDPAESLDESVRRLILEKTGKPHAGPIRLLTNLSYFGYCFNPISLYYCFDQSDQRVETIVAEVSNTPWGEKHCYVLADQQNLGEEAVRRFEIEKELHVSPFMKMNMSYAWTLKPPADDLLVKIQNRSSGDVLFGASLNLKKTKISGPALARVLLTYPLMTFRIMLGIHWQAIRLWLKGCPVEPHPAKPATLRVQQ